MTEKIKSEIIRIDLADASYKDSHAYIEPTYVNFFFGNNGAGKSTIAKAIKNGAGVTYAPGRTSADYLPLVYNQEFIDENFRSYRNMRGVFTLNAKNAETQQQIDEATEERTRVRKALTDANDKRSKKAEAKDKLYNTLIEANNAVVAAGPTKKAEYTDSVFSLLAFMLKDIVAAYRKSESEMQIELDTLDTEIAAHNASLDGIKTLLQTLRSKTVETETAKDSINRMLWDSGMRGFSLEPKPGVDNVYEVRRPDKTIADNLSEGEKNFIAFLYFYHLVLGSDSADSDTREKIVVIDDPVSSMDSGSLFIVSTLVRQMIEICRNNADNRNPVASGNFIKQIFILTHNAYFHREVSYSYVTKYDYASFYLIRKIGTKSTIKMCDDVDPNEPTQRMNINPVKNSYAALWDEYREVKSGVPLMNVIRRILEYYFLQLCGYEGSKLRQVILVQGKAEGRFKDAAGNDDDEKFQLASAMLAYINANTIGMSDGMDYVEDCLNVDECRSVFEMIFDAMDQKQHYEMMYRNK